MNDIWFDLIIVIAVLALWLVLISLVLRGWRNRGRRQVDAVGEIPVPPDDPGPVTLGPDTGLYLGATFAPSWQNRVAVGDYGDRAASSIGLHATGILVERDGASPVWIPRESITAVRTERGHAGKVMTADGVLVIRWALPNGTELDTGFRADDKSIYPGWVAEFDPDGGRESSAPESAQPDIEQRKDQ
ncbi:PH-like domain-containing protein [Gordonia sp. NPDC003376]